jgi:undecaprenyl diphosphate synthase
MSAVPSAALTSLPGHVAIIMDGNGRWAKARGLPRYAGHQRGADTVRTVVRACRELGIPYLTLYAFSSENWKRPPNEIDDLMGLLRLYIRRELAELHRNGVRVRIIGNRQRLDAEIVSLIEHAEETTRANRHLTLVIALDYGSQQEIVDAARKIAEDVAAGRLQPADVDDAAFRRRLQTADIPDPDILIRTSGEQRLSNFLLWQAAYAELIFIKRPWPDFTKSDLINALEEFQGRERRYGASSG